MLQSLKQVRAAFSMLRPEQVIKLADRPVAIGLVASSQRGYSSVEESLAPASDSAKIYRASDDTTPPNVDLILYEPALPCPRGAFHYDPREPEAAIHEIVRTHEDLALPLARQFRVFREPVVERIVQKVARENALFAITTALPNMVPSVFELPWSVGEFASDTAFLTMNQIRMAFLIAAAYGADVGFLEQKGSMLSIVGGAFGWRAIARELAGKIPLGGGLIPKGAIAYAGTYVAGKCLERWQHAHEYPTPAEREEAYQAAFERGKKVAESVTNPAS
jgi:hypothetical protein